MGRVRRVNEDFFRIVPHLEEQTVGIMRDPGEERLSPFPRIPIRMLAVADGVGGAPAGEFASALAVESFQSFLKDQFAFVGGEEPRKGLVIEWLFRAVDRCQSDLAREVERDPERFGMGTTLTAAVVVGSKAHVVHAGDSKCYLYRDSVLRQLTHDHTQAQYLADAGVLALDRVRASRLKHVVWNTLGSSRFDVRPEVMTESLQAGDLLLLCTDGLTDQITDEEIAVFLSAGGLTDVLCRNLMDAARRRRAGDDVTVIVARFGGTPPERKRPSALLPRGTS